MYMEYGSSSIKRGWTQHEVMKNHGFVDLFHTYSVPKRSPSRSSFYFPGPQNAQAPPSGQGEEVTPTEPRPKPERLEPLDPTGPGSDPLPGRRRFHPEGPTGGCVAQTGSGRWVTVGDPRGIQANHDVAGSPSSKD